MARRSTASPASRTARTTTCQSRSRRPSSSCASSRSCAGAHPPRPTPPAVRHSTLADLTIDLDRYEVTRAGRPIPLTRVEFRLLTSLIEAGGRVLTRDQLLDAVYGQDGADVLDRTVDVHIGRLRDKLGDDADDPRYVATVRGVGYRAAGR